jgi:Bax protein
MTSCWRCFAPVSPYAAVALALMAWWLSLPNIRDTQAQLLLAESPITQETIALDASENDEVALTVTLVPAPNFASITLSDARKQSFVASLLPLISQENAMIATQRKEAVRLYALWQKGKLSLDQKEWLVDIATNYEVEIERKGFALNFWQNLLHRLDGVPPSLVLTQAAIETGWGTSRLAKDANNFFGIMCFKEGCGVKSVGSSGEFRRFDNAQASVAAYMRILNTKGAYRAARMERMRNRLLGEVPSGLALAKTLLSYSELGQRYVSFLIKIMHENQLEDYDGADAPLSVEVTAVPDATSLTQTKVK